MGPKQLLRKVRRKISWTEGKTEGWKDGQTDRGKTVYPFQINSLLKMICDRFELLN